MSFEGTPALVTGASGFLGGHLAGFLKRRGYRVQALVRATSDTRRLQALGVELVQGDLARPRLARGDAPRGSASSSTAPPGSRTGARARRSSAINRDGAGNVVAAAREAGVERVVHASSLTVLGLPRGGEPVDESTPLASGRLDPYSESKLAGERLVREAHGQGGLATVIVRPGVIWGPGDPHILPRIVALLRRGRMVYIGGGRNHVALSHVENLSLGLALAAEVARRGGTRLPRDRRRGPDRPAGASTGWPRACGTPRPRLSVPFFAVYGAAALLEAGARLAGRTRAAAPHPLRRASRRERLPLRPLPGRPRARLCAARLVRAGRRRARATLSERSV